MEGVSYYLTTSMCYKVLQTNEWSKSEEMILLAAVEMQEIQRDGTKT